MNAIMNKTVQHTESSRTPSSNSRLPQLATIVVTSWLAEKLWSSRTFLLEYVNGTSEKLPLWAFLVVYGGLAIVLFVMGFAVSMSVHLISNLKERMLIGVDSDASASKGDIEIKKGKKI